MLARRRILAPALTSIVALSAIAVACGDAEAPAKQTPTAAASTASTATAAAKTAATPSAADAQAASTGNVPGIPQLSGTVQQTASGLRYLDEVVGTGATVQKGQNASVHYTGWLTTGHKFDSSRDRGQPFTFGVGAGRVIAGWDEGVAGMKVGGKRRLILPPALGYGAQGAPGAIPPNATLIFDVEVLAAQ